MYAHRLALGVLGSIWDVISPAMFNWSDIICSQPNHCRICWYTTLTEKLTSHELILLHVFARLPRFKVLWKNGVISDILHRQNTLTLKTFFLRVLNTKNFTHYHDMFPSTAGKKVCFRSISQHSYILLCLLSKKILSILLMVHFISIPGTWSLPC